MASLWFEDGLHLGGDGGEAVDDFLALALAHVFAAAEVEGEHGEDDALAGEGLGAGDADFRAGVEVDSAVDFAGDGAADGVDDAEAERAFVAAFAEGGEGVGGFAALADGDEDGPFLDDGVSVAEFARRRCIR